MSLMDVTGAIEAECIFGYGDNAILRPRALGFGEDGFLASSGL
jgi:hypothetical protein